MKKLFFGLTQAVVLSALLTTGCSKSGSDSAAPATGGVAGTPCYIPGYVWNGTACVPGNGTNVGTSFAFQAWSEQLAGPQLEVFKDFLKDINYCDRCRDVSYLIVRIDLGSTTFPSRGRVAIGTGYEWAWAAENLAYPVTGGFEFRFNGGLRHGTPAYNDVLRVVGIPVDAAMTAVDISLYYNGILFATTRASRLPAHY